MAVFAAPSRAQEGPGVKVGVLSCSSAAGWGLVLGSSRSLHCTYQPNEKPAEHYEVSITKIGLDLGYKGAGVLIWTVVAPTTDVAASALQGKYGGVTAGVSAGVGVGASALVGGSKKQISLQPLSIEGNTGLNVAGGIGGMTLKHIPGHY